MHREIYSPSGRVGIDFLLLSLPAAVAGAFLLAGAICLIWYSGLYFALGIAIIAASMLSAVLAFGVRIGRCRNRVVASTYGAFAGLLMFVAAYYIDMVASLGTSHWLRVDAVPAQIRFRIETDRWARGPLRGEPFDPAPSAVSNGVVLAAELLLVLGITVGVSVRWSGKVYCETGRHWAECHWLALPYGCDQRLMGALATGNWGSCESRIRNVQVRWGEPYCEAVLEICREPANGDVCCAYLSARESRATARLTHGLRFLNLAPYPVRQCALRPEEIALLRRRLAGQESA